LNLNRLVLFSLSMLMLNFLTASASGQGTLTISVVTDKITYDHGEVITITGQVQSSGSPVPNAVVVFELRDSQNNVRATGFMTTDQVGAFSRTITVGADFLNGSYSVYCSVVVGDQVASNSASFQVVPEFPMGASLVTLVALVVALSLLKKARSHNPPTPTPSLAQRTRLHPRCTPRKDRRSPTQTSHSR